MSRAVKSSEARLAEDFGINVQRAPVAFVDVHLPTGELCQVKELTAGSGWGTVPTPMF